MCDTFVALPAVTGGPVIFGKNSDREPNEAQSLEYHPAAAHKPGDRLKCTYIEIPQAEKTNAVLLSRPFWMWGAEIGANEHGVTIGNEAVWSKMPLLKQGGLTGMDLLRLALERGSSAETALETITELLAEFGQGGECGYQAKGMVYHNSYIIADPNEAWVLETAGPLWAALKVDKYYAISNGLTIGEDFTLSHPELINTARRKGWLKKGRAFNFRECYSEWFYTTFSTSRARRSCSMKRLQSFDAGIKAASAMSILRDHGNGEYRPDGHFLMNAVCAHSANTLSRHASQSTGSMVAELSRDHKNFWATGTSAPCTGIFKPYRFENGPMPDLGTVPGGKFDSTSLWWRHELVHRQILNDFSRRSSSFENARDALEKELLTQVAETGGGEIKQITEDAFLKADQLEKLWIENLDTQKSEQRPRGYYRRYWNKQSAAAGIPA